MDFYERSQSTTKKRFQKLSLRRNIVSETDKKLRKRPSIIVLDDSFEQFRTVSQKINTNQVTIHSPIVIDDSIMSEDEMETGEILCRESTENEADSELKTPNGKILNTSSCSFLENSIYLTPQTSISINYSTNNKPSDNGCSPAQKIISVTPKYNTPTTDNDIFNESQENCSIEEIHLSHKKIANELYGNNWKSVPNFTKTKKGDECSNVSKKLDFIDDDDTESIKKFIKEYQEIDITKRLKKFALDSDQKTKFTFDKSEKKSKKKLYTLMPSTPDPLEKKYEKEMLLERKVQRKKLPEQVLLESFLPRKDLKALTERKVQKKFFNSPSLNNFCKVLDLNDETSNDSTKIQKTDNNDRILHKDEEILENYDRNISKHYGDTNVTKYDTICDADDGLIHKYNTLKYNSDTVLPKSDKKTSKSNTNFDEDDADLLFDDMISHRNETIFPKKNTKTEKTDKYLHKSDPKSYKNLTDLPKKDKKIRKLYKEDTKLHKNSTEKDKQVKKSNEKDKELHVKDKKLQTSTWLTPELNSNKDVKGTERKIKTTIKKSKSTVKNNYNIENDVRRLSFMASLADDVPKHRCDSEALVFKQNFKSKRDELTRKLFIEFNRTVFDNKLDQDLVITWESKLRTTAGTTTNRLIKNKSIDPIRTSSIKLSSKVIDSCERLRDTLIHELCHVATWIIDHELRAAHGPLWTKWAKKALTEIPELVEISRCHDMEIHFKYSYKCTQCGYSIQRHSKSIDIEKKCCGYCRGKFELLTNRKTKAGSVVSTPAKKGETNAFALYVKENYGNIKNSSKTHAQVMKILGEKFSAQKLKDFPIEI